MSSPLAYARQRERRAVNQPQATGEFSWLDVAERAELTVALSNQLQSAVADSLVMLRGSLAEGHADRFSDIDLLWDVPDTDFARALDRLPEILSLVRRVASLRSDPDFQRSRKRLLLFVRFAGVPLFWRIDLDVFAQSATRQPDYDRDNPAARGSEWSLTESSLMNAIAAIKAACRGQENEAHRLLHRAEGRIGLSVPDIALRGRILRLVHAIAIQDAAMRSLANDVHRLVERCLPPTDSIPR
jgi:predicted nucleotidyltransferase